MPSSILTPGAAGTEEMRLALTLESWIPRSLLNHMETNSPLYKWLQANRMVKRGGVGLNIEVPYTYDAAGNARMTGVNDPFVSRSRVQPRGVTRGTFRVAELLQTYSIPEAEAAIQGNKTTVLSAVEMHIEMANRQWTNDFMAMIWAAETDAKSAGAVDQVASIRTLVNKAASAGANTFYGPLPRAAQSTRDDGNGWVTGTHGAYGAGGSGAVSTIGGISRTAVDTGVQFCCPTWYQTSTGSTFGRLIINEMISAGSVGSERIDIMFMDPTLFDSLLGILQAQQQLEPSKMAEYGFTAMRWRGVEFLPEDNMPAGSVSATGQVIGICSKNLEFVAVDEKPRVKSADAMDANVRDYRVTDMCQLIPRKLGRGLGVRHTCILKATS